MKANKEEDAGYGDLEPFDTEDLVDELARRFKAMLFIAYRNDTDEIHKEYGRATGSHYERLGLSEALRQKITENYLNEANCEDDTGTED